MAKKVIIIGAGIAGLSAAVRLLSQGYEVTVYERQSSVGGKTNQFTKGPFTFDLTASILMNRHVYEEIFQSAGLRYEDYLEFTKIDPTYRCFCHDGTQYDFSSDLAQLVKTIESVSTEDAVGFLKFMADVYERYTIANKYFLTKSFEKPSEFFNPVSIFHALETKSFSTPYQLISKYIKDEKLREYLCYQALYVGISPYDGPSIYTLVPVTSQLYGLWHLKGGMYSFVKALEKAVYRLGGTIVTNFEVGEIIIANGKAVGIRSGDEIALANVVLATADFTHIMNTLIQSEEHKGKYSAEKMQKMQYTCSTFILYLGLRKQYPQLSVHNIFLNREFKENIDCVFTGSLPMTPSFYFYCPTRIDPGMVSMEGDCINIVTRVPNLCTGDVHWDNQTKSQLRQSILQALVTIPGLEDIESNIQIEACLTPYDLQQTLHCYGGAAFGLSPTLTQTNYFRPHVKSDAVESLYFAGDSIHPGPGVSIVLLSSKLAVQKIMDDASKECTR